MYEITIFEIIIFSIIGSFIGVLTGLIPGLHPNNIALLLILISSSFQINLYLAIIIVSASIAHTFFNIIPSTFIGAPEDETALVVLPAHSMLLEGKGYNAVCISAISSLMAIAFSFIFLLPTKFILIDLNFYEIIKENIPVILICISAIIILTSRNVKNSVIIFILSGLLGISIIDLESSFLLKSSPIFPALAGLFGVPTLVYSYKKLIPKQRIEEIKYKVSKLNVIGGLFAGEAVSILPGVSSAIAASLALSFKKKESNEEIVSILSVTNTATSFFVIAMLFLILKARSGCAIAVKEFLRIERWEGIIMPTLLNLFLIAVIISSIISYFSTKSLGKFIAKNISKISYPFLLKLSLAIIIIMVFIFNGFIGLIILFFSSIIGILCLKMKVRRSICMGVLLIPLIISYLF